MIKKFLTALGTVVACTFLFLIPVKAENVTVTFFTPYSVVPKTVPKGTDMTYKGPTDVNVPGFVFCGWNVPLANVQTDLYAIAIYALSPEPGDVSKSVQAYTTLKNLPTGVLSYSTANADTIPAATQNPQTFTTSVSTPATLTATETLAMNPVGVPGKTCVVKWYNGSTGELWKTDVVAYGATLPQPADPCIPGLEFVGWDGSWSNITSDRSITACYYKTLKLIFQDRNGNQFSERTIRSTDSVEAACEEVNKIDLDYKVDHWDRQYSSDGYTIYCIALGNDNEDRAEYHCEDCDGHCHDRDDCKCNSDCRCYLYDD